MSSSNSLLLLPCVFVAVAAYGGDAKEREKLEGRWRWVKSAGADNKNKDAAGILFKGDTIAFMGTAGKGTVKGTYKIDPTKKPMTLDITLEKDGKKTTTLAIYDVNGDILRICHFLGKRASTERPKEFVADKQTVLGILKRDKD